MHNVYLNNYEAACASGINIDEICHNLKQNKSGINARFFDFDERKEIFVGSFPDEELKRMQLVDLCLKFIKKLKIDLYDRRTLLIIASTKADIDTLRTTNPESAMLDALVGDLRINLRAFNYPILISNACVSGISALLQAHDFIKMGYYKKVAVCGVDLVSHFVVSGFNSLTAISPKPCTPYDKYRTGVSLGEAIAVAVLSDEKSDIEILGGASANDANHISGPSRTGEGLILAVKNAIKQAGISNFDFINAHGTATVFNDEMESQAFNTLGFQNIPLNSLKGYFGHTLGAAGLLETLVCAEMMKRNIAYKSLGFEEEGTTLPLNILRENREMNLNTVLKTASGFGGTNAAIILKKG
ncbi:MAG TPA: beta-ketoacyl synthase N-terminal-like domain-containing protein [Chitinophagales bacterium]